MGIFCAQIVDGFKEEKKKKSVFVTVLSTKSAMGQQDEPSNRFTYFCSRKMIIFLHIPQCYLLMRLERFSPC